MITPKEIKKKAERSYRSWLKATIQNEDWFPLPIKFRKVKAADDYNLIKGGVGRLIAGSKREIGFGYSVVLTKRNMRKFGEQSLPTEILIETEIDYLRLIGKKDEVAGWRTAVADTRQTLPQLEPWLLEKGYKIIPYIDEWSDILLVVAYFLANPLPDLYIRELPIPVHTKFIEERMAILQELLDFVLPETAVIHEESSFFRRFGLRYDQPTVRLRLLDHELVQIVGWPAIDLTFRLSELAQLDLMGYTIYIIENKMSFLTFPQRKNSLAIWGSGFQVTLLSEVSWLSNNQLYYWGDLDAQGLQILSQLRASCPLSESLLMDELCLMEHEEWFVAGTPWKGAAPAHLRDEELTVFQKIVTENIRLEQERIPHRYLLDRLNEA